MRHFFSTDPIRLTLSTSNVLGTSTGAVSGNIDSFDHLGSVSIFALSTAHTSSIQVQVSASATATTTASFQILQSPPGTDVIFSTTGMRALVITTVPFKRLRLESTSTADSGRTFDVLRQVWP